MITRCLRIFGRLRLRHKITLAVLLNMVLVLICFILIIDTYQKNELIRNLEQNNRQLAESAAQDAADNILIRDLVSLDALVNSVQKTSGARFVAVSDRSGRIIAHTEKKLLGQTGPVPEEPRLLVHKEPRSWGILKTYTVPVRIRKDILGHVSLGLNKAKNEARIEGGLFTLRRRLIITALILLGPAFLTAYLLALFMTKRIRRLKDDMRRVQEGDLTVAYPREADIKCSEYLNCGKTECPAFERSRCWTFANRFLEGYKNCLECAVYQSAAGDEIGELQLTFTQMVHDLDRNLKKLEQANQEKNRMERLSHLGQMSAQVAHEIKNPLNAITGSAQYIKKNFQGAILNEFLAIIEQESERLNEIVTDFLNFSKPGRLEKSPSDLNALVKQTLRLVEKEAEEHKITLRFEPCAELRPFPLDPAKIKQALLNLLLNALEATEPEGSIQVKTELAGGTVRLLVRDSGQGIPPEQRDQLFKPFYTTKTRGSGLGLAVADQNVRAHKGRIELDSEPGQGSTFSMIIGVNP